jgi:hypothetical protein
MIGSMEETPGSAPPDDIKTKLSAVAHHEAGHMVIAAAVGLAMRAAGFGIDPEGQGLACYCFRPEDTDVSRERVLLATFAGWYAQQRFCDLRGLACPDFAHPGMTQASIPDMMAALDQGRVTSRELLTQSASSTVKCGGAGFAGFTASAAFA